MDPIRSTTSPSTKDAASSLSIEAIAGMSGGGLVALLFAALLLFCCYRIRSRTLVDLRLDNIREFNDELDEFSDKWEISPSCITIGEVLGEGAFGKVYIGLVKGALIPQQGQTEPIAVKSITIKAAIKMLQPSADYQQSVEFHEEIKLMKEVGQHKNVISMLGCCTHRAPLCLVVEYMPYGDLLHYLRDRRKKGGGTAPSFTSSSSLSNDPAYVYKVSRRAGALNSSQEILLDSPQTTTSTTCGDYVEYLKIFDANNDTVGGLAPEDLLGFSWQIATGMEFLSTKGFVHRDLAARNVLVGANKCVKISDFGLTRLVYEEKMYTSKKNRRLPLKWMSVEAIFDQVFTAKSDVWAYGVVLFEIGTLGGTPYPTIDNRDLLRMLKSGYRMERPENCCEEVYDVMRQCWDVDPDKRPSFCDLRETFDAMIREGSSYIDFNVDEDNAYYNVPSFASIEEDPTLESGNDVTDETNTWQDGGDPPPLTAARDAVVQGLLTDNMRAEKQRYASPEIMRKHQHPSNCAVELDDIKPSAKEVKSEEEIDSTLTLSK